MASGTSARNRPKMWTVLWQGEGIEALLRTADLEAAAVESSVLYNSSDPQATIACSWPGSPWNWLIEIPWNTYFSICSICSLLPLPVIADRVQLLQCVRSDFLRVPKYFLGVFGFSTDIGIKWIHGVELPTTSYSSVQLFWTDHLRVVVRILPSSWRSRSLHRFQA